LGNLATNRAVVELPKEGVTTGEGIEVTGEGATGGEKGGCEEIGAEEGGAIGGAETGGGGIIPGGVIGGDGGVTGDRGGGGLVTETAGELNVLPSSAPQVSQNSASSGLAS
jgi:hypothetical protein